MFGRITRLLRKPFALARSLSPGNVLAWFRAQPLPVVMGVVLTSLFFLALAINGGYNAYDYVQHDNDFCWSCHLMREPFTAFDNSAHAGLGCKACHQPTMIQRSKMGLVAILERPEVITHHADVPNDVCSDCHVDGDPEEWLLVASTAGHQAHLDPYNRELDGVRCVQCHSASVHTFGATNDSCTQSGCHSGTTVVLGGMGELEITCISCHFFERQTGEPPLLARRGGEDGGHEAADDHGEAAPADDAVVAVSDEALLSEEAFHAQLMSEVLRKGHLLTPDHEQCTACHAMRERLVIDPEVEPHQAVCGACHDPHGDRSARDPARACASAECHGRPDTLDVGHHRWPGIDRYACLNCHKAHTFRADEDDCTSCHDGSLDRGSLRGAEAAGADLWGRAATLPPPTEEELREAPREAPPSETPPVTPPPETPPDTSGLYPESVELTWTGHGGGDVVVDIPWLHVEETPPLEEAPPGVHAGAGIQERPDTVTFVHARHRALACQTCHEGGLPRFAEDPRWCDGCHHTPRSGRSCTACHRVSSMELPPREVEMRLPGGPTVRELDFPHGEHASQACSNCHGSPPTAAMAEIDCKSCHAEHHGAEVTCARCHQEVPRWPHDPVLVHSTCAGGLCHFGFPPAFSADVTPPELPPDTQLDGPREGEPDWWRRNVCEACHQELDPTSPLPRQPPWLQIPGRDSVGGEGMRIAPDGALGSANNVTGTNF